MDIQTDRWIFGYSHVQIDRLIGFLDIQIFRLGGPIGMLNQSHVLHFSEKTTLLLVINL